MRRLLVSTALVFLCWSLIAGCGRRTAGTVEVLTELPSDADLVAKPFAPAGEILSGFDRLDPGGQWRVGDAILLGLQIDLGGRQTVRFILIELKSQVLPRDAEVIILGPRDVPPPGVQPADPPHTTADSPSPDKIVVAASEPAEEGAFPPGSGPVPKSVYIRLTEQDDPALIGRLPGRFWTMPLTVRGAGGGEQSVTRDSGAVFIAVHVFDEAARKLKTAGTLAPEAYLRRGLFTACELAQHAQQQPSADRAALGDAVADVLPTLYGLGQVIRDTPSLASVVRPIIPTPSLWALLTHGGADFAAEVSMADIREDMRPLPALGGGKRAFLLPLGIDIKGEAALQCLLSVTDSSPPFHLCGGVIGVDGVQVRDASRRFCVRVLAAHRASGSEAGRH